MESNLSMSSRSTVDRAPGRCSEGHGFGSFVPLVRLCQVDEIAFHNMLSLTVKVQSVHILITLDDLSKEGSLYGFYKGRP